MPRSTPPNARPSRVDHAPWVKLGDEQLLDLRMSALGLTIEGSELEERTQRLLDELDQLGFVFKPHFWLSNEWFTPVGVPGVAIPFYLAHPRLKRLERSMMLEVEGGTKKECMKILRHEAGHAIQYAYRLNRRAGWRRHFGRSSDPYPETYQPRPYSRRFVVHIDNWYAQAHPDEDFAETFAVWLTPGSHWRKRYRTWPAIRKLEYVDELMHEIRHTPPPVRSRRRPDAISTLHTTLREHYTERRETYAHTYPEFQERDLRRLFDDAGDELAATFLRRRRRELLPLISRWTGQYQYTISQVYREVIYACEERRLRVPHDADRDELAREVAVFLTVQTMNHLHDGGHRLTL